MGKYKLFLLSFIIGLAVHLFCNVAQAACEAQTTEREVVDTQQTPQPDFLKDATVTVTLKDGTKYVMQSSEFMVVPRTSTKTSVEKTHSLTCNDTRKNEVSLLVGSGPTGKLHVDATAANVSVDSKNGALGGLQYQRKTEFFNGVTMGGQVLSNKSGFFLLGKEF